MANRATAPASLCRSRSAKAMATAIVRGLRSYEAEIDINSQPNPAADIPSQPQH